MPGSVGGAIGAARTERRELAGRTTAAASLCVYLTDGYGTFPEEPPEHPVFWVVIPGGLPDEQFPFGTVVRMV